MKNHLYIIDCAQGLTGKKDAEGNSEMAGSLVRR